MSFVNFIQLLLVIGILIILGIPLFAKPSASGLFSKPDRLGDKYKHLLVRKEEVLLSIKDLDFDLKTDKVSQEDYAALRNKLELEAAALLEKLDQLEKEKKSGKRDPEQTDAA